MVTNPAAPILNEVAMFPARICDCDSPLPGIVELVTRVILPITKLMGSTIPMKGTMTITYRKFLHGLTVTKRAKTTWHKFLQRKRAKTTNLLEKQSSEG